MIRALLLWSLVSTAVLQSPTTSATQSGPGRIGGIVVDGYAQPVPRAIVRVTGSELPGGRAVVTDERGAFGFERLPAGRYSLTASKPAYLTAAFGAIRPGGTGTPIVLAAAQQLDDVKLAMPHGGAVAGVVRDVDGAPVRGISVYAMLVGAVSAARTDAVYTDDRGAYRVFGLAPGDYYVVVQAGLSGGIGEVGVMSSGEVDAAFARLKTRGATAATPTPAATADRSPSSIVRPTRSFVPSPVFFPGVTTTARATTVALGLGEAREGVDVVYQLSPAASVSGTVSGAGALNVSLTLIADQAQPTPLDIFGGPRMQRRPAGDGAFEFTSVTPGKYTVMARVVPGGRGVAPPNPDQQMQQLFAIASVDVNGIDVTGISLTMQPALHVRGRLAFEGQTQPSAQVLSTLQLRLLPAGATPAANAQTSPVPGLSVGITGSAAADGTFQMDGVLPGSYRMVSRDLPGWRARSAKLGDVDVFDTPFEVSSTDVGGIEVTLTDRHSRLSGRLSQADGSAAPGYFVVVFSTDRSFWTSQSRRTRSVRPGTDGEFRIDDLPAGEYYLAALTDADSDDWQTPAFLAQVIPAAVKVSLGDGDQKVQDLRIGRR